MGNAKPRNFRLMVEYANGLSAKPPHFHVGTHYCYLSAYGVTYPSLNLESQRSLLSSINEYP